MIFRRSVKDSGNDTRPSTDYDEIDLSFGREAHNWTDLQQLVKEVNQLISALDLPHPERRPGEDETALRELIRGFGATHRQMLHTLNESIAANEKRRVELDAESAEKDLARSAAHETAVNDLAREREKLQLQSYKSERRRIMQDITDAEALKRRRDLAPRGSTRARWAVFLSAILLGVISFGLTYQSITEMNADSITMRATVEAMSVAGRSEEEMTRLRDALSTAINSQGNTNWFLIVKSVLSSIVGVAAFAYAAQWLRTFYDGEIAAARAVDQFNHDLVRASWVIETVLEVKQEHESDVPQEWIEGVTRGLFADSGARSSTDEGIQALKALLGFSASASFGPEGPQVELNRKGAKRLAQE